MLSPSGVDIGIGTPFYCGCSSQNFTYSWRPLCAPGTADAVSSPRICQVTHPVYKTTTIGWYSKYTNGSKTYEPGCLFGSVGSSWQNERRLGVARDGSQEWKLYVLCASVKPAAAALVCTSPLKGPGGVVGTHAYLDVAGMQTGFFPTGIKAEESPQYDKRECAPLDEPAEKYLKAIAALYQNGKWLATKYAKAIKNA
jgi:hypothetical protein